MVLVASGCATPDLSSGLGSSVITNGGGKRLHVNQMSVELVPFTISLFQRSMAVVVRGGMVIVVV